MSWRRILALAVLVAGLLLAGGMLFLLVASPPTASQAAVPPVQMAPGTGPTAPRELVLPPTWTPTIPPTSRAQALAPATELPPSPTLSPTPTPQPPPARPTAVQVTATQNPSETIPLPTAVPAMPIPEGAITVALLGSDQRPDWNDWHTDAIQYLIIYPDIPAAALLSIPRDLYVYVPGFWMSRVNFADMYGDMYQVEGGGLGLLNQTLLYNLGITADYYVKVDFDGLIGLVDALGGIEVPVHCRLEDYWPYANEQGEYDRIALEPGIHHMDGELALWYARSRMTTNVFSRERRQQQVLEAMWRKAQTLNPIEAAPSMYEQTRHLFETNLGLGNILSLAATGANLSPADVKRRNIGWYQLTPYTTPYGGAVFLPQWPEIEPLVRDVLAPPAVNRASQGMVSVEVWNGTPHQDLEHLAADSLLRAGFSPVIGTPDRRDMGETLLVFFGEGSKGSGLEGLQAVFNIRQENVVLMPEGTGAAPFRLILGADYDPCRGF